MSQHLPILREIFPSQTHLSPKQVARALHGQGNDTKKRTETVRAQLDAGTLIPGIRKGPGEKRWRVKIVDLAAALDGEAIRAPGLDAPVVVSGRRQSRFKNPGPRLARLWTHRSHEVWQQILDELQVLISAANREALLGEVVDIPDRPDGPPIVF